MSKVKPSHLILVGLGGALGTALRFTLERTFPTADVPWTTLGINLTGSFALALLIGWLAGRATNWRLFLGTGLISSYTTYSALAVVVARTMSQGHLVQALAYGVGTVVFGVVAAGLGLALVNWVKPAGAADDVPADGAPTPPEQPC